MKFTYCFNQLREIDECEELLFLNYIQTLRKGGVDLKNYWTADFGTIEASSPEAACERLFRKYNSGDPHELKGYVGRSMSVSDVVELWPQNDEPHTAWFCDSFGFVKLQLKGEIVGVRNEFEIILPTGEIVYIPADTRREAIQAYSRKTGCPEEFVKGHCVVRNAGWS